MGSNRDIKDLIQQWFKVRVGIPFVSLWWKFECVSFRGVIRRSMTTNYYYDNYNYDNYYYYYRDTNGAADNYYYYYHYY